MRILPPWSVVPLLGLALSLSGCTAPVAPSALASVSPRTIDASLADSATPLSPARLVTTFPLMNGSFTLTLRAADGSVGTVTGTYTGQAVASVPGNTTASLDMSISAASGIGASITGLKADGAGAFVEEGDFTLSLTLASSTSKALDGAKATLRGISRLSCSTSHLIVVTQHGTQSTPKFVEIAIDLRHEVGLTGC